MGLLLAWYLLGEAATAREHGRQASAACRTRCSVLHASVGLAVWTAGMRAVHRRQSERHDV